MPAEEQLDSAGRPAHISARSMLAKIVTSPVQACANMRPSGAAIRFWPWIRWPLRIPEQLCCAYNLRALNPKKPLHAEND